MTSLSIIAHDFNGNTINQLNADTIINGVLIPKGYVNATEMCKANGKRLDNYFFNKKTEEFLTEYNSVPLIPRERVVIPIIGGSTENQGTWVYIDIALHLAMWISPSFSVWAMKTLSLVIKGDYQALTAEAEIAQAKLQHLWQEIRTHGKATRRKLTDAIKDWYERNPGGTSCPYHAMFAITTNNIYKALWDKDAKEIETLLGCNRNESRDHMDAESLRILERAEDRVMEYIDLDNLKPKDAVLSAKIRPSLVTLKSL